MALEGQPPWRPGNPEKIRLLQIRKAGGNQFAVTFQRRRAQVVISTWSRMLMGGRDADVDDYVWDLNDTVYVTVGILRKILRAAG